MTADTNDLCLALWAELAKAPCAVLDLRDSVALQLLRWNDHNGDFDNAGPAAPYWLLRAMADDALLADFDRAQEAMGGHTGTDAHYGLAEELATLMDRATRDEAMSMVDDWRDRCGLPDDLYESLYAWAQDNHDGGRV